MKAYVFPGQGAQFSGMGAQLYDSSAQAKDLFETANDILGFQITEIMFSGTDEDLKQTKVTQPAIFLHSVIMAKLMGSSFIPQFVAGHSLGEFSALVAANGLSFEDGLKLVSKRALAMQAACEQQPSTMAAILGLEDKVVEHICNEIDAVVVPANYNCPGQLVISGSIEGVETACNKMLAAGAKRALVLPVGGAFHSPLMMPAQNELADAINSTNFAVPICPLVQNYTALASTNPDEIRKNLILQLTGPVKWTQSVLNMIALGAHHFIEVGPGKALQGMIKKIDRDAITESATV